MFNGQCESMTITVYSPAVLPHDEAVRLRAVGESGLLTNLDQGWADQLCLQVCSQSRLAAAGITIVGEETVHVVAGSGVPLGPYRRSTSLVGHAILCEQGTFFVGDAATDVRFAGSPVVETGMVRTFAAGIIRSASGFALGALCVYDPKSRDHLATAVLELLARSANSIEERSAC